MESASFLRHVSKIDNCRFKQIKVDCIWNSGKDTLVCFELTGIRSHTRGIDRQATKQTGVTSNVISGLNSR